MHEGTTPTNIVDKNGRATVVWRRVQPAYPNGSVPAAPPSPSQPRHYEEDFRRAFANVQPLRITDVSGFDMSVGVLDGFVVQPTTNPLLLGSAVSDSLRRMTKDDRGIEYLAYDIEIDGKTRKVHFVGSDIESKLEIFQQWAEDGATSNDHHSFTENFGGNGTEWDGKIKAWFAPEMDIAWTIDEEVADKLIKAVQPY